MRGTAQQFQHTTSVVMVLWLAENLIADHHNCVRSDHNRVEIVAEPLPRMTCFFRGKTEYKIRGTLAGEKCFVYMAGEHLEIESGVAQNFSASRRRGSE